MKKSWVPYAGAVLVFAWAAAVISSPRWSAPLRPKLEEAITKALGRPAKVGGMRLSWTGSALFSEVDAEGDWGSFQAPEVRVRVSFLALLRGKDLGAAVRQVRLVRPVIRVAGPRDGAGKAEGSGLSGWGFSLPEVAVEEGTILIPAAHPSKPLEFSGSLHSDGGQVQLKAPSGGRIDARIWGWNGPHTGADLQVRTLFLSDLRGFIPESYRPGALEGLASGSLSLEMKDGKRELRGKVEIKQGRAQGGKLRGHQVTGLNGTLELAGDQVHLAGLSAKVGGLSLSAAGTADLGTWGKLALRVKSDAVQLSEIGAGLGGVLDGRARMSGFIYGPLKDPQWDFVADLTDGRFLGKPVEKADLSLKGSTKHVVIKSAEIKVKDGGVFRLEGGALRGVDGIWDPQIAFRGEGLRPPSVPGLWEDPIVLVEGGFAGGPVTMTLRAQAQFTAGPDWRRTRYDARAELGGPLDRPFLSLKLGEVGAKEDLLTGGAELKREDGRWNLTQAFMGDKNGKAVLGLGQEGSERTLSGGLRLTSVPGLRDVLPGAKGSLTFKGKAASDLSSFDLAAEAPLTKELPVKITVRRDGGGLAAEASLGKAISALFRAGPPASFRADIRNLDVGVFAPFALPPSKDKLGLGGIISGDVTWNGEYLSADIQGKGLKSGATDPVDFRSRIQGGRGEVSIRRGPGTMTLALESNRPRSVVLEKFPAGGLDWSGKVDVEKSADPSLSSYLLKSSFLEARGVHGGPFEAGVVVGASGYVVKNLTWGPEVTARLVSEQGELDGWFELKNVELSGPAAWAKLPVQGRLSGSGRLTGDAAAPQADGIFWVRDSRIKNLPLDELGGRVALVKGVLSWDGAVARGRGRVLVQGSLDLKAAEQPLVLKATVENGDFGEFLNFFPAEFLKSSKGQIHRILLLGKGPVKSPEFSLDLEVVEGRIFGIDFDALAGGLSLRGGTVALKELGLRRGEGVLTLRDGVLGPQSGSYVPFSAAAEAKDIDLQGSLVSGKAALKGRLPVANRGDEKGLMTLRLDAEALRVGDSEFPGLGLDVELQGSRLGLDGRNKLGQSLKGQLEFLPGGGLLAQAPLVVEDGGRKRLFVSGRFDPRGESDLEIQGRDVDASWLNPWIPEKARGFFQGQGDLDVSLKGPSTEPLVTASLDLRNGKVGGLAYQSLIGLAQVRGGVLDLSPLGNPCRLVFQGGQSRLLLSGSFPLSPKVESEGNLEATLTGGDLSFLQLSPLVRKAKGALEFSAKVKGRWGTPVVSMLDLSCVGGEADLENFIPHLRDIDLKVRVRDNLVQEARLEARSGSGRVHVRIPPGTADVILKGALPDPFIVDVWTSGGPAQFQLANVIKKGSTGEIVIGGIEADNPFHIRGSLASPVFEGRLKISNSTFTWPPEVVKGSSGYSLKTVAFKLDLVSGPGLVYYRTASAHTALLNMDAGQTIIIRGQASEGNLGGQGRVLASSGTFPFGKTNFQVTEGSLNILPTASVGVTSDKDYMPYLEGKAENLWRDIELPDQPGTKTDLRLILDFKGKIDDVEVGIRSEPTLESNPEENVRTLLQLVLLGRFVTDKSKLPASDAMNVIGGLAEDAATQSLIRRPIDEKLKGLTGGRVGFIVDTNILENTGLTGSKPDEGLESPGLTPTPSGGRGILDKTTVGIGVRILENLYADSKLRVEQESKASEAKIMKEIGLGWKVLPGFEVRGDITEIQGQNPGTTTYDPGVKFSVRKDFDQGDIVDPEDRTAPAPSYREVTKAPGGALIEWITDERARCRFILKEKGKDVVLLDERGEYEGRHEVVLEGRQPDTTYDYLIMTEDRAKNTKTFGPYTLTTGR